MKLIDSHENKCRVYNKKLLHEWTKLKKNQSQKYLEMKYLIYLASLNQSHNGTPTYSRKFKYFFYIYFLLLTEINNKIKII